MLFCFPWFKCILNAYYGQSTAKIQKNTVSALKEVYIYESSDNLFFCVGKINSGVMLRHKSCITDSTYIGSRNILDVQIRIFR